MQLLSQSRYDLAETALRRALSENPDDATAHALLALCCAGREEFDKAMQEVEVAIGLAPAHPLVFYVQSCVLTGRNCFREAEAAIRQAIELDPDCSEHWAQLARVHLEQRQWAAALAAAEQGLTLDPEDDTCLNLRALSLARLGRRVEAGETIQAALRRNPEDALTHANMGWSLLERAQPQQALEHFREALRLDAENEWARQGVVEAMKARHFLYRIVLGWFLWMLRLPGRAQWGILLGAFVGYQLLRNLATSHPQLAPFVTPLLIAYVTFALMTWLAAPLLNLTLRLNRFGRLALTREQIVTSNWVGLCVLGALLSFGWYVFYGGGVWLVCAVSCALIIPPLSHIYSCHAGWPRVAMVVMTMALGSLGCLVAVTELLAPWVSLMLAPAVRAVGGLASNVFLFGAILAQFAVNALVHVRPRQGGITPRQAWQMGIGALLLAASLFAVVAGVQVLHVSSRTKLPIVFRHPIRTRLVKDDDVRLQQLSWPVQERESAALVDRGFTVLGSCTLEGVPDLHLWVLYHEAQSCVADFLEESPNRLVCRIMTRYQDGRLVTYSNGPEAEGLEPPQCTTEFLPGASAVELYEHTLQQRPQEGIAPLTRAGVAECCEERYARHIDFLLERRGPTLDELRSLSAQQGGTLSDRRIEQWQALWRQQAGQAVDTYVLDQFLAGPAADLQITLADRDRLLCIHALLDADTLRTYSLTKGPPDQKLPDAEAQVEAVLRRVISPRDAFAGIAQSIPYFKKVATVDRPIPTDIYLISR